MKSSFHFLSYIPSTLFQGCLIKLIGLFCDSLPVVGLGGREEDGGLQRSPELGPAGPVLTRRLSAALLLRRPDRQGETDSDSAILRVHITLFVVHR